MALFYLIRHGEPDYESVSKLGFYGFGRSFAPLSERGVKQAEETAKERYEHLTRLQALYAPKED